MLKCTINGKEIEVKEGTTIIQAFKQLDEDIAHYCWHPALSVAGVCRLCMVEIEGNPRLQIACNTPIADGMVVSNNSEKVKDAVKWGLDFHLINHPLDCPICDQAGECGLQDQYMQFGKYDPEMAERKVKKRKVVDLGERVVLDSERCILCSRCVRFTEEVTQTNELGIFNRGDRSEIGTFEDKPLNNKYSVNTVDICPVGALTSKDFRFKQRVWFLKDKPSICTGCSTGCSVDVYYNKEGVWRLKPRYNEQVNGYWMCDEGRDVYKHVNMMHKEVTGQRGNKEVKVDLSRLTQASRAVNGQRELTEIFFALEQIGENLSQADKSKVALVITGQDTLEEQTALIGYFTKNFGTENIYHWQNNPEKWEEFDGLLLRGDRNPNTNGLKKVLSQFGVTAKPFTENLKHDCVIVAAPENTMYFPEIDKKIDLLSSVNQLIWLSSSNTKALSQFPNTVWQIPTKTFVEKSGTFVNYKGLEQKVDKVMSIVPAAIDLIEVVSGFQGEKKVLAGTPAAERVNNEFINHRGEL